MGCVLRILTVGDVVGKPGRDILIQRTREIRERFKLDFVVANAENAAGGSGLTPEIYKAIIENGVDCVTLGDHAFRQKAIFSILNSDDPRIVRPGNYPPEAPGRGWTVLEVPATSERPAVRVAVFALLGRVFMQPIDCPLRAADKILDKIPADVRVRVLDFHAEATSEKQTTGRYLDGRVSAVLGTHTHVATADETILPGGTAFQCDIGMTGPFDGIIGRRYDRVLETTKTFRPTVFEVATGDARLNGTIVDVDSATGKAVKIERLVFRAND